MQKWRTVITVVMLFICLCASLEDYCWVDTYDGEFMSPCFDEGRCRCNNITADCSSNNGSLTYVPRLPIDVQVFNFSSNNLSHIPDEFFSNVSQVWLLDLCQNGLTSLSPRAFQELQNLTTLLLNGNSLVYKALTPVFHIRSLTNLQILCSNLSPMDLETFSNNSLGALTLLNVSLNNIGSLYMKSLEPLKGLSYFIAQQNKLYNLTTSRLKNLFFLNLQKNRLFDFPQTCDLVTGESFFPNLKLLLLQNNMISSIKDPVCLPNLANLSLSFNKFLTFESNTFGNARFPRLEYLALIEMEDKIVGIERFAFNNSQLKFLGLALNYINLSSQTVLHDDAFGGCTGITAFYFDYCVFKAACLLGQAAASFTIAVIIIVLVVFIISVTCFRYRWHLRLVMYEWFHHRGLQEGQLRHFTYDVFVGYAEEDRKWVMQELLPVVEGQWNLRACVHERDFIPGKHIVDNIADCVQDSRKILMVFSPDYARSEWCQFELKYCQCCVMDRDEVLVLVLLHETESRDMTSAMFAVMKTTTYIEWANTVDARDSFWGRLSRALDCVISY
ncbi:hypothetical protein C0Q70_01775 [Pomacea canaliculata]|uniref:TIR domain-containing protein n=1 Tax=Pomacea canaliculata TaxID=400727 RepID=A0A2T7Q0H9_POMCA|nr:hypothetical protein C0Q70_01775 [Pomacea canaliculata]